MSSSDSEEDEDDDVNFAFRGGKVPSPPGRINRKRSCQLLPNSPWGGRGEEFFDWLDGLMVHCCLARKFFSADNFIPDSSC